MLGFLPIIGPIISGLFGTIGKYQEVQLAKIKDDTERVKIQQELTLKAREDASTRLMADMAAFPVVVWMMIATWDTIVAKHYPNLMFIVADFPKGTALEYLPHAVLAFLFGMAWLNKK